MLGARTLAGPRPPSLTRPRPCWRVRPGGAFSGEQRRRPSGNKCPAVTSSSLQAPPCGLLGRAQGLARPGGHLRLCPILGVSGSSVSLADPGGSPASHSWRRGLGQVPSRLPPPSPPRPEPHCASTRCSAVNLRPPVRSDWVSPFTAGEIEDQRGHRREGGPCGVCCWAAHPCPAHLLPHRPPGQEPRHPLEILSPTRRQGTEAQRGVPGAFHRPALFRPLFSLELILLTR